MVVNSAYSFVNQAQTQKKKKHKSKSSISSSDSYSVLDISDAVSISSDLVDAISSSKKKRSKTRRIFKVLGGVILSILGTAMSVVLKRLLTESADCQIRTIGNGVCDILNNNEDCEYDGGDCSCAKPSDCPDGGTKYLCINHVCECPSNLIEENDKCIGMLKSLRLK